MCVSPTRASRSSSYAEGGLISATKVKHNVKVGITLKQVNGGPIFISKISVNSLFASGELKVGQEIVAINNEAVADMTATEAVAILKQVPTGDSVTILASKNIVSQDDSDTIYDDACQFGQFVLNPCWFLYQAINKQLFRQKTRGLKTAAESRLERALLMSTLQQGIYLSLFWGSWVVAFTLIFPVGCANQHFPVWVAPLGRVLFTLCVASWIVAKFSNPGSITQRNMHKYDNYRYDGILYQATNTCPTLGIRKLARSKFDRFSRTHVPRFDHFCGWLGNTIGEENYRFFLSFLFAHILMFSYAIPTLMAWMWGESQDTRAALLQGGEKSGTFLKHIHAAVSADRRATIVLFVCFATLIPLTALFSFHVSIIRKGMTTNEYFKWQKLCSGVQREKSGSDANDKLYALLSTSNQQRTLHKESPALAFYDLGFGANLLEVFLPRCLHTGFKES